MKFCNRNKKPSLFIIGNISMLSLELNMEINEESDYIVYVYNSVEEALQELKTLQPKIVILDSFPGKGMNGQQAIIAIRSLLPDVYSIVLSANNDADAAIDLIKSGADSFIYKAENTVDAVVNEILSLKNNNQYSL